MAARELSTLTQLELETWLKHPTVGLADYAERIRMRSAVDTDDLDGPYWDDEDIDLEELDELWDAKKSDQLLFMNAIVGARQDGIEPALLVRGSIAANASSEAPATPGVDPKGEHVAVAAASRPADPGLLNTMLSRTLADAVDAGAGLERHRSSSDARAAVALDCAPLARVATDAGRAAAEARSAEEGDLVDFAALLGSEGAEELGASTPVATAVDAPVVREDIARFIAITSCALRTSTYYVDGALERGRGVDGAVDYFYDQSMAPPPPEYTLPPARAPTNRVDARAPSFASASGGGSSGDATPRAAPYVVGERVETQWWAQVRTHNVTVTCRANRANNLTRPPLTHLRETRWAQGGSKSGTTPSRGRLNRHTYYRGVIVAVNGDGATYAVAHDDGDTYTDCPHDAIRPLEMRTQTPHSGAWLAAASSIGQWCAHDHQVRGGQASEPCTHGVIDVLAPHWRCCGCIDPLSELCIETRLGVFDFVVLRGGVKPERKNSLTGKPELEVGEFVFYLPLTFYSNPAYNNFIRILRWVRWASSW